MRFKTAGSLQAGPSVATIFVERGMSGFRQSAAGEPVWKGVPMVR
jgi:hypothetical protein